MMLGENMKMGRRAIFDPSPPGPPPINFVHDHLFSAKLLLFINNFRVRLGKTISGPSAAPRTGQGRALRLGQTRGPGAAAT